MVRDVFVDLGERVEANAPVLLISEDISLTDGTTVAGRSRAHLDAEVAQVRSQITAVEQRAIGQRALLIARRSALRQERTQLLAELPAQQERVRLAEENDAAFRSLEERGFASRVQVRRVRDELLLLRQGLASIQQRLQIQARELQLVDSELSTLPTTTVLERAPFTSRLSEIEQQRAILERQGGYILSSPVSGSVAAIQAFTGQQVDPERALVIILPADSVLIAELYVPSSAIGLVRTGQRVALFYDAFPYQQFGVGRGIVTEVSRAALLPPESSSASAQQPAFRVLVALDRPVVTANERQYHLQVGMTLRAAISVENKRVWEIIAAPIGAAVERAFAS